jgi:hypothetical protein
VISVVFERQGEGSGEVNGLAHVCFRPLADNQDRVHATTWLEIEAEVADGFDDAEVGIVRDNAKQLKFTAESTGFDK